MADKSAILKKAQQFQAKGQVDKAIAEWKKLISETPNDGNIYNTIGDLYLKVKKTPQALETYLKGAETFREAGFALKTIAIYKKLIKLAPDRIDILVKLGELNVERGLANNAIQDFLSAAKKYSQTGKIKESLDVYRKIADLDPSKTSHREKLAEMCLKGGLKQDAVIELLKLRNYHKANQNPADAETVQGKINSIDPTGELQGVAQKILGGPESDSGKIDKEDPLAEADTLIEKGDFNKAVDLLTSFISENEGHSGAYEKLATAQLKAGNKDAAYNATERAVQIHIKAKEFGPAGKLLKDFLNTDPERVNAHILLGEVYESAGNPSLAVPSFAHAIDEHLISGDTAAAKELYSKIKTLDPQHRDVRRLRHSCEGTDPAPAQPKAAPIPEAAPEPALDATRDAPENLGAPHDAPVAEEEPSMVLPDGTEEPPADNPGSAGAPFVDPGALEEYFTEAEVFIKYGLLEKAIAQMNKVLALDPENTAAHEKLIGFYQDQGDNDKAVAECIQLMGIYKNLGDSQKRDEVFAEAQKIDPENPKLKEASELSPLLDSGRVDALLEEEGEISKTEAAKPAPDLGDNLETTANAPESLMAEEAMPDPMAEEAMPDPMAEEAMPDPMAEEAMPDPMAEEAMPDPMAEEAMPDPMAEEAMPDPVAAEEVSASSNDSPETLEAPVSDGQDTGTPDLSEKLSEADFYFSQGIIEEAQKIYEEILAQDPLCSSAREKLDLIIAKAGEKMPEKAAAGPGTGTDPEKSQEEIDLEKDLDQSFSSYMDDVSAVEGESAVETPAANSQTSTDPSGGEDLMDLSEILNSEEIGAELENLFDDVEKENLEEEAVEEETDFETHYNLGIAYKEMGLVSEAIVEFEKSIKGPGRFIDSSHMLAGCYEATGETARAIDLLNKALENPKGDETQKRWLHYDLASLHEKDDKLEKALEEFQAIQQADPKFKDVSKRIKKLEGLLGKGESVEETSQDISFDGDEDLDLMMDKVFGEMSSPDLDTSSGKVGVTDGSKKKNRISYL